MRTRRPRPSTRLPRAAIAAVAALGMTTGATGASAAKKTPATKVPVVGAHPCGGTYTLSQGPLTPGTTSCRVLLSGGLARNFLVQVPAAAATRAVPLVVMFHGTSQDGLQMLSTSSWSELATKQQFAVAFPSSMAYFVTADNRTETKWHDAGLACDIGPKPAKWLGSTYPADDVGFVDAMLVDIEANTKIDASRVYASGFSNGANFALTLSVSRPDTFAAAGAWAGRIAECRKDGVAVDPVIAPHLQKPAQTAMPTAWGIGNRDHYVLDPVNAKRKESGLPPFTELPMDEAQLTGPLGELLFRDNVEVQGLVWTPGKRIEMTDWSGMSWMPAAGKPDFITLQWTQAAPGNTAGNTHTFMLLDDVEHQFPNARASKPSTIKTSNGVNAPAMFWQFFVKYRR